MLNDIKNIAVKKKPFKIFDGGGLYLLINPNGTKYWRLHYRFDQTQKTLAFGVYPNVSLLQAREKRTLAKQYLARDIDPSNKLSKKAINMTNRIVNLTTLPIVPEFDVKSLLKSITDQIGEETVERYKEILKVITKTWEFVNVHHIDSMKIQNFLLREQQEKLNDYDQFFKDHPEIRLLKQTIEKNKNR